MTSEADLDCAVAFARLELLELQNRRRSLTQCPGIETVARAIASAKGTPETTAPLYPNEVAACEAAFARACLTDRRAAEALRPAMRAILEAGINAARTPTTGEPR